MDTGAIIAIVVAALILLAVLWFAGRAARERRHETRREQAHEIRREAEVSTAQADKTRAEAEAQAAEARRQEALARERAASADEQQQEAREGHIEAAKKDPDADEDEVAARFDAERSQSDTGRTGADADDQSVEHYEHTSAPGVERERRFERNEQGEVVRDEEYEKPPPQQR